LRTLWRISPLTQSGEADNKEVLQLMHYGG